MKEFIEYVAKSLVDKPEQVIVKETETGDVLNFELSVAREDMGKVIGREGGVIQSIRTILSVAAAKQNKRATLEIIEK